MPAVSIDQFDDYFYELHGRQRYPWQRRLAERAVAGSWPGAIDLPTGSGKTACLDIAVFALAAQAKLAVADRTAPRRIFFCVNRRVIVDEAFRRARRIATAIWAAERGERPGNPVLRDVAAALRLTAGAPAGPDYPPLDVLELRGGIYRDNRWARSLTQPTIICTTLDQLGSRLLFRGYGVSSGAAPIQAALIAYDSLILLDEAHISEPFRQSLQSVRQYLDPGRGAERPLGIPPMTVVPMTATPTDAMRKSGVVTLEDDDRDPGLPLDRRLRATKPTRLRKVSNLVKAAVDAALEASAGRPAAVGILVNRIATARAIYAELRQRQTAEGKGAIPTDAVLELVIGSIRPIDRDRQSERLDPLLGPDRPWPHSAQTSFVVATQCLEVGADLDFDVLITECASLDALRQRFGRLNRGGRPIDARAVLLAADKDIKPLAKLDDSKPLDSIYGNALSRTWFWLSERAENDEIDFGVDALDDLLNKHTGDGRIPSDLLAPTAAVNAPVMLPAYLDLWCQTSPRPALESDVSLFIHGPQPSEPDVQVCWRADLVEDDQLTRDSWCDVVALLPPTAAECMSVPMSRARRWLTDQLSSGDPSSDALGVAERREEPGKGRAGPPTAAVPPVLVWRGVEKSSLLSSADDLRPGDTMVLPAGAAGSEQLGHLPAFASMPAGTSESASAGEAPELIPDLAEVAFCRARDRAALRLHPSLKHHLPRSPQVQRLLETAQRHCVDRVPAGGWADCLRAAADDLASGLAAPAWMCEALGQLIRHGVRIEAYPDERGVVLVSRKRLGSTREWFLPAIDDGEDDGSRLEREAITLAQHSQHVLQAVRLSICFLPPLGDPAVLERAAQAHDLGKADERFQAMLRRTDRTDAWLLAGVSRRLLAKSEGVPLTLAQHRQAYQRAGVPAGFRHEMLSLQLAEHGTDPRPERGADDLVFHLIASHHGYARPFAPFVPDEELPPVSVDGFVLEHEQRCGLKPPHRIDAGIAERFWRLNQRYGWWGLAYLEALVRLADQRASAAEDTGIRLPDLPDERDTRSVHPEPSARGGRSSAGEQTSAHPPSDHSSILMPGIDGSNPLAYLAALGLFRLLSLSLSPQPIRLNWEAAGGIWTPRLTGFSGDADDLLEILGRVLTVDAKQHPIRSCLLLTGDSAEQRRLKMEAACGGGVADRGAADWLAAMLSDIAAASATSQLQTVRRDYFRGNIESLITKTTPAQLARSLFKPWDYADALDNQSLHLDPSEDRRHAHQWNKPSGDPTRKNSGGMMGANRLALEAFPLFPSIPDGDSLRTAGFSGTTSRDTRWTWPIWQYPIDLAVARSILLLAELQQERLERTARRNLAGMGISAIFRTQRILVGKTPNFTPAQQVG